jgi:hypothetical protein
MALRTLNSVVAANYNKLTASPVLAGDIVMYDSGDTSNLNPMCVKRAYRSNSYPYNFRGNIVGVSADDALGTNPNGETPTMINNDPAGSNFVNASTGAFQSFTAGFYVGTKRAIGDFKDEGISVVTNLTAGIPTYEQRGISVYSTPSSQFVTDRFTTNLSQNSAGNSGTATYTSGSLLTVEVTGSNNDGKLCQLGSSDSTSPIVGRVDYYDSGAGLLYWTLL